MVNAMSAKILVVDDSPEVISMLNEMLTLNGFQVFIALGGEQALSISAQITPDMILMDAMMPGINGFEACERLKASPDLMNIPVIFMTGLSDTEDIVKGFDAGGVDYITKPIRHEELLVRMRSHLGNAKKAANAHMVMDGQGLMTLCIRATGEVEWATPQIYRIFGDQVELLGTEISASLEGQVPGSEPLQIQINEDQVRCHLIDQDDTGRCLLKIDDPRQPDDGTKLVHSFGLTEREAEVLLWIVHGKTNKEIAQILGLSPRTINKHLEQVFRKMQVDNRTSAAFTALQCISQRLDLAVTN